MVKLNFTETHIRHHTTQKSFERGQQYYRSGAVVNLVRRDRLIQALVEGSEYEPYRVTLTVDSSGIKQAGCSCPYDYEGWCKHIIAVALACIQNPDLIREAASLDQLLSPLDLKQTQTLLQKMVEEYPELMDEIERWVPTLSKTTSKTARTAKKQSHQRKTAIDLTPFRSQARFLLRQAGRSLEDGWEGDPIEEDLPELLKPAQTFIENGDGKTALTILAAITETLAEQWDEVGEYGLDATSAIAILDPMLAEAILVANLDADERVDLQANIEEWEGLWCDSLPLSTEALRQGWDDKELLQILQGKSGNLWPDGRSDYANELAQIRLRLLEQQNRLTEYLHFAHVEEQWSSYLIMLIRLERVEEALTLKTHLRSIEDAFDVAKLLREHNFLTEAVQVAQQGLPLPKRQPQHWTWEAVNAYERDERFDQYELADWASELAEGIGDRSTALELRMIAFKAKPSLKDYQQAAMLAEMRWQSIRNELLDYLKNLDTWGWGYTAAKVDIFLMEKLVEDAIAAVARIADSDLLMRVMDTALSVNPQWVLERAASRAEEIMNRGQSEKYREAVQWLTYICTAHRKMGQQRQWKAYCDRLVADHGKKRKLMTLMKDARLIV
jgi:uncharacterized Zn finger protein